MLWLIQVSTSVASPYKSLLTISWGKTFLRISRVRSIPLTWILARVFVYVPPFISQILDFICWTVLIFVLIYFECRDTENQQLPNPGPIWRSIAPLDNVHVEDWTEEKVIFWNERQLRFDHGTVEIVYCSERLAWQTIFQHFSALHGNVFYVWTCRLT